MYAIMIEFAAEPLQRLHEMTPGDAHVAVSNFLVRAGFDSRQGIHFGNETINAVTCVMAAIDLSNQLTWLADSVRDIRMLRIEELNDLMPAIQQGR